MSSTLEQRFDRHTLRSARSYSATKFRPLTSAALSKSSGGGGKKVEEEPCAMHMAAEDLLKAVTQRSKEKVKVTMDALSTEARRIEEEIEEFSSKTAKEVASLVTKMSDIEDESADIAKKKESVEQQIESLVNEKKTFELLLGENKEKLEKLQAKKDKMDQMTDIKIRSLREKEREVKDILGCWTIRDEPKQLAPSANSEIVEFLREAIAQKEEDLLCPVCLEPSKVPIFSCPDSHIICSTCVPKLQCQECPQCRVRMPERPRRDRFAEKTAKEYEQLLERLAKLTGLEESPNAKLTELDHSHKEPAPKSKLRETDYETEAGLADNTSSTNDNHTKEKEKQSKKEVDADRREDGRAARKAEDQRWRFATRIFENTTAQRCQRKEHPKLMLGNEAEYEDEEQEDGNEDEGDAWAEDQRFSTCIFENTTAQHQQKRRTRPWTSTTSHFS